MRVFKSEHHRLRGRPCEQRFRKCREQPPAWLLWGERRFQISLANGEIQELRDRCSGF